MRSSWRELEELSLGQDACEEFQQGLSVGGWRYEFGGQGVPVGDTNMGVIRGDIGHRGKDPSGASVPLERPDAQRSF